MKILLIVIFVLTTYVYCEEAEERSDKYSFEKDNEVSETNTKEGYIPVKESNSQSSNYFKGYEVGLNTNQETSNGHGQFVAIPKAQSYQYIKHSPIPYQFPQSISYGHNAPASVPYQFTYKSYPLPIKTFNSAGMKQNVPSQFVNFANIPQANYGAPYLMSTPQTSKPIIASLQMYEAEQGSTGLDNAGYGSNNYVSNQYKFAGQYTNKPVSWANSRVNNGFESNINGFETIQGNPAVAYGYGPASTIGMGHGTSSTNGYTAAKIEAPVTFVYGGNRTPKMLSYGTTTVGTGFKYGNPVQSQQYFKQEYKPIMVNGYESGLGNGEYITKTSEFNPYMKQQYKYVVPKQYGSSQSYAYGTHGYNQPQFGNSVQYVPKFTNGGYSSVPSFEASMSDIFKMISAEQRKAKGKAIFLIGKPNIPLHMLTNQAYSTQSSEQDFGNNVNVFPGYKY